jgi:hypothetical protein
MLTVLPATTTVVDLAAPVLLGTEMVAVPLVEPEPVTVAHDDEADDQLQPLDVVTVIAVEPAVAGRLTEVGDTA